MADGQYSQLRFDILEKVRLHPQQPGIGDLLELDLTPDVEIEDQGSHLKIRGYLRLNGRYRGDDWMVSDGEQAAEQAELSGETEQGRAEGEGEEETEELAYVIPVEITLPANRAAQDHISAEVESFDYHVLSPFELQIEAVLAIDGFIPEPSRDEKTEEETSEDSPTFSGYTPSSPEEVVESYETISSQPPAYQFEHMAHPHDARPAYRDPDSQYGWGTRSHAEDASIRSIGEPEEETDTPHASDGEKREPEWDADDPTAKLQPYEPEDVEEDQDKHESEDEKPAFGRQDMKIGFQRQKEQHPSSFRFQDRLLGKPEHPPTWPTETPLDFASDTGWKTNQEEPQWPKSVQLFKDQEEEQSTESADEVETHGEALSEQEQNQEKSATQLEWAKWLIGEEEEQFVKIKMVIAQKEDSIDSIAEKYDVLASQLVRLNHLEGEELKEGQIIHIPQKIRLNES
ncbi:LysM peptidoglycan-binding domain-containing protein [Polycladomyces subterraneus]|uniref:LysM peptidoglycan-binding domain-containing protein n=1 Tax=Polycladomyces subterraneus TaxID=1016997 RepID=A0ABT8II80_9BACL|nr:LysM peptidoglycan-binding domain-containing protein [Polycladomyces subterraneus]MDN4592491.1 LysM peptidoglycan-binding domain-containing protein [Polycladomyces subterraneus]